MALTVQGTAGQREQVGCLPVGGAVMSTTTKLHKCRGSLLPTSSTHPSVWRSPRVCHGDTPVKKSPALNLSGPSFLVCNVGIAVVPATHSCREEKCVSPFKVGYACGGDCITDRAFRVLRTWSHTGTFSSRRVSLTSCAFPSRVVRTAPRSTALRGRAAFGARQLDWSSAPLSRGVGATPSSLCPVNSSTNR